MIKGLIIDCFGVVITDALEAIRAEVEARDPAAARQITDYVHLVNRGIITSQESNQQIAAILNITTEEFRQRIASGEVKNQALLDWVAEMHGKYKTAMLSNIASPSLARRFTPGELERYFDVVVTSGDIGYAKPEPQAYQITADRLGVRYDQCLMVDDRPDYCQGAQAIGMQAIAYKNLEQLQQKILDVMTS